MVVEVSCSLSQLRDRLLIYISAVGSILGWLIAQNSHAAVSVVCRSNWNHVQRSGFKLKTDNWGTGHFVPRQVIKTGSMYRPGPGTQFDYVVLANKIKDDYAATLSELRSLVSPNTALVSAQNGMDVEVPLRQAFPANTILSAVCNIGCSQTRPGHIEQTAGLKLPAFSIGAYGQLSAMDILKRDVLASMDADFGTVDNVNEERWRKLIFNSAWNSTTALTGLNTHQLLEQPGAAELVFQIAGEAHSVGTASGIALDSDLPARTIELARKSSPITTSTLQDIRRRCPMELDFIFGTSTSRIFYARIPRANTQLGYLVSQAAKVGLRVPYLTRVYELLLQRNSEFVAQRASAVHEPSWGNHLVIDLLSQETMSSGVCATVR